MTPTMPTRGPLYIELAARINALVGSAPGGTKGKLTHLVTLTGMFESAEGFQARVGGVSKVGQGASLFDITLDLGMELTDATIADAKAQIQQHLHGTIHEASCDGPYLLLRYDSRPDDVYMEWATTAARHVRDILQVQGPLSAIDQEFDHPTTTTMNTAKTKTAVQVTRRMGETGFTVRITPDRKQCLANGKTWTEDGGIAALKHCLPGYLVTSVTDYSNQQIIATVTPTSL